MTLGSSRPARRRQRQWPRVIPLARPSGELEGNAVKIEIVEQKIKRSSHLYTK